MNKVSAINISDVDILFNRVIRSCNLAPVQIYNVRVHSNNDVQLDGLRTATTTTGSSNEIRVHSHLRMLPGTSITDSSTSNILRLQGVTLCNDTVIASALLPPTSSNGTLTIAASTFTSNVINTHRINVHTIGTSNILFPNNRLIVPALTTDSLSLGSDITYTRPVFRVLASTDDSNDVADGITFSNDGTLIARRLRLLDTFETQTTMGIYPGINTSNLQATKLIQAALSNVTVDTPLIPTLGATASNRPMVNLGSASNPFDHLFMDQRGGITLGVGAGSNQYHLAYNSNTQHVYLMGAQSNGGVVDVARLQLGLSNFGSRTLELSVDQTTGYLKTSTDSILPSVNIASAPSGSYKVGLSMNPSTLDTADTLQVNGGVSVIGDIRATGHIHLPGYSNDGVGNRIFRSAGAGRYFEFQQSTNATPLVRLTEGGQMTLGLNSVNRDDSQLDPAATMIVHGGLQVTKGDVKYSSGDLYVSGDIYFNRTKKLGGTDQAGLLGPDYLYLTSNAMVFDAKSASSTSGFRFAQSNGLMATDWMRINGSNGYVGLFTNTPSERLEVASGNIKVPRGSVAIGSNLDVGCNVFIGARSNGISLHTQPGLLHVRNAADSNPGTVVVRSIAFKSSTTDTLTLPETRSDIIALLQESIVALQARVGLLEAQLATLL